MANQKNILSLMKANETVGNKKASSKCATRNFMPIHMLIYNQAKVKRIVFVDIRYEGWNNVTMMHHK